MHTQPADGSSTSWTSWYDAWREASVGSGGFWRSEQPAAHFRTAANSGLLARLLVALLADRPDITTVVDIGSGDGRLLADFRRLAPRLRLCGIDLRPKPATLERLEVDWIEACWDVDTASWRPAPCAVGDPVPPALRLAALLPAEPMLIVCAEWLDEIAAVVAVPDRTVWRQVLVGPEGEETTGGPVSDSDADWLDRWWPAERGLTAESGRSRDEAWAAMIANLRGSGGLAVMIDYGHHRNRRPAGGSLTGYRLGRQVPPRPSAMINLTAQVAVDSVRAAGEAAGARTELMITQREITDRLLPDPPPSVRTLARLQARSERRALSETFGDHWWLVQSVRQDHH